MNAASMLKKWPGRPDCDSPGGSEFMHRKRWSGAQSQWNLDFRGQGFL